MTEAFDLNLNNITNENNESAKKNRVALHDRNVHGSQRSPQLLRRTRTRRTSLHERHRDMPRFDNP